MKTVRCFHRLWPVFLCHKNHPRIGLLVTSILSSPTEAKIIEKEQKFLKLHNKEEKDEQTSKPSKQNVPVTGDDKMDQFMNFLQFAQPFFAATSVPRAPTGPRSFAPRFAPANRFRFRPNFTGCYNCGDLSHIRAQCPHK